MTTRLLNQVGQHLKYFFFRKNLRQVCHSHASSIAARLQTSWFIDEKIGNLERLVLTFDWATFVIDVDDDDIPTNYDFEHSNEKKHLSVAPKTICQSFFLLFSMSVSKGFVVLALLLDSSKTFFFKRAFIFFFFYEEEVLLMLKVSLATASGCQIFLCLCTK